MKKTPVVATKLVFEALREQEEGQDRPRRVGDRGAHPGGDAHEDAVPGPGPIDRGGWYRFRITRSRVRTSPVVPIDRRAPDR